MEENFDIERDDNIVSLDGLLNVTVTLWEPSPKALLIITRILCILGSSSSLPRVKLVFLTVVNSWRSFLGEGERSASTNKKYRHGNSCWRS